MKKLVCVVLMLTCIFAMSVGAFAANPGFVVSDASAMVGEEFTVTVSTTGNPGVAGIELNVEYDSNVLEWIAFEKGVNGTWDAKVGEALTWFQADGEDQIGDFTFATLTFKALAAGDTTVSVSYAEDNVYNANLDNVSFSVKAAAVSIKDHDHVWDAGTVTAPTCTDKGYTTYACTVSGCTETKVGDEVPAAGHKEETVAGKAPTCTEDGLTEGKKCSACGVITAEQTAISATGHTGGKATCASGAICDTCGNVYGEKDSANHAELVTEGAKEATCTEAGSTGTGKCNACGTELDAAIEIPALGHIGGEACCVELAVCERCGESYGELNPNSHCTYVWAEAWAGSCTHPSSDAYIYCEDCLTWWVIPEGFTYEDLCDEAFDVSELGEAAGVLEDEFTVPEELIGDLNPDNHYCYESDEDYHWTTCEFGNGEREEHNWSDWEKADNYKYRYCWDCGYWDEVEISASATSPKTGDEANIALWIVMTLACGAGAVLTLKKKEN